MKFARWLICALLLAGCADGRYHWTDVPYCEIGAGARGGHFEGMLRVLTEHGDGGGISRLHGMRPHRSVVMSDEVRVAVIACETDEMIGLGRDLDAMLEHYDDETVPEICPGQRVVVPPTLVTARPTTQPGYDGALHFPSVPREELRCAAGTVALGSSP